MTALAASKGVASGDSVRFEGVDVGDGIIKLGRIGRGEPVIFLHGWTLDGRMWQPQRPLSADHELVMIDRRGFGSSTAPPDLAREAQDIETIRKALGFDKIALVGLSQGAAVALDHARHHPGNVRALALLGTPLHGIVPDLQSPEAIPRSDYARLVGEGRLDAMKQLWRTHPLMEMRPESHAVVDPILEDYDGRDQVAGGLPLMFKPEDVTGLSMPVLAATGTRDTQWRRDIVSWIGSHAPHGKSHFLGEAGHLCNVDNPEQFNSLLATFLRA